jgi:hypothetical protein
MASPTTMLSFEATGDRHTAVHLAGDDRGLRRVDGAVRGNRIARGRPTGWCDVRDVLARRPRTRLHVHGPTGLEDQSPPGLRRVVEVDAAELRRALDVDERGEEVLEVDRVLDLGSDRVVVVGLRAVLEDVRARDVPFRVHIRRRDAVVVDVAVRVDLPVRRRPHAPGDVTVHDPVEVGK